MTKLLQLLSLSKGTLVSNAKLVSKIAGNNNIGRIRLIAIKWIIGVVDTTKFSPETRDTAIQIVDAYLSESSDEILIDLCGTTESDVCTPHLSVAAAVAIILASKIHELKPLTASNFPHFQKSFILDFERHMLGIIGFAIFTLSCPANFIRHMIDQGVGSLEDREKIMSLADQLIGLCWKDLESLQYAPSTIAIASLLLSFSKLHIDCSEWLCSLPDICLPPKDRSLPHPVIDTALLSFLDADRCLLFFQQVYSAHISANRSKFGPLHDGSVCQSCHNKTTPWPSHSIGRSVSVSASTSMDENDSILMGESENKTFAEAEAEANYCRCRCTPTSVAGGIYDDSCSGSSNNTNNNSSNKRRKFSIFDEPSPSSSPFLSIRGNI